MTSSRTDDSSLGSDSRYVGAADVSIDRSLCFGSSECIAAAPTFFTLGADGLALTIPSAAVEREAAEAIAANCPSGAVKVAEKR